jgi:osmotically-inducible protein OsmY
VQPLWSIVSAPFRLVARLVAAVVGLLAAVVATGARSLVAVAAAVARLVVLPVRLAASVVVLAVGTSARAVAGSARLTAAATTGSARAAAGAGRAATRSRVAAFAAGAALGGFLASPTGRRLLRELGSWAGDRRPPVGDDELAERVRAEVRASPRTWHLEAPEIDARDGVVHLRGEVPHPTARADLESVVTAVPDVVAVDNRLTVAGPAT